jgi:hypothetical protein
MCPFRAAAGAQVAIMGCLALLASSAAAQDVRAFSVGYTSVGPTIGIGGLHGAALAFGGRIEHGVKALPGFGNGVLGIEVSADVHETRAPADGVRRRYVPLGVTANYHFILNDRRIDPFVGIGVGYLFASASAESEESARPVSFLRRAGIRWRLTPLLSLYAEAGTGGPMASGGVMLTFR